MNAKIRLFTCCLFTILYSIISSSAYPQIDTILFDNTTSEIPYRIPAIAQAKNGDIFALSDYRTCKADIGYGKVDILAKISKDNGKTWGEEIMIAQGNGIKDDKACGYGDASIVADRNKNEVLIMMVAGNEPYPQATRTNPNRVAMIKGKYDQKTKSWQFSAPKDITNEIYSLLPKVTSLFFTSGKICQSRQIKKSQYYRLYAGLCTLQGNFVLYSDDFGKSWQVLGNSKNSCIISGNECKCEELPNGDVLLSSRADYGRIFNIFHYTNKAKSKGYWNNAVMPLKENNGIYNTGTACNGEVLLITAIRKLDNKKTDILLQSVVANDGRNDVTIYYKELKDNNDYSTPNEISKDWDGEFLVSKGSSAYSTMIQLQDGNIAFYFEDKGYNAGYNMRYCTFSIEQITQDKYTSLISN